MKNWWVSTWKGWDSIKSWDVGQPLRWTDLNSWNEETESKKLEHILGNDMKQAQQDCCDRSEVAEETEPKHGVRKRVEKGMDWGGKEK